MYHFHHSKNLPEFTGHCSAYLFIMGNHCDYEILFSHCHDVYLYNEFLVVLMMGLELFRIILCYSYYPKTSAQKLS